MKKSAEGLVPVDPPFEILAPPTQRVPLVLASPHSGDVYPESFLAESRLDALTLRQSEDSFVDELFGAAVHLGLPLLRARFPRAYVDPNREPYELDPEMFEDRLPDYVHTGSPRVAAGLGTIPRIVSSGNEIFRGKLRFAEAKRRIDSFYRPYHRALSRLVAATRKRFGVCLLVDCHSMPSVGGPTDRDPGRRRGDTVLGDGYRTSCAPFVTEVAEQALRTLSCSVVRNDPYSGGFTTRHYGRPQEGVHALQIEINRALYMDEATFERSDGFALVTQRMAKFVEALALLDSEALRPAFRSDRAAE